MSKDEEVPVWLVARVSVTRAEAAAFLRKLAAKKVKP